MGGICALMSWSAVTLVDRSGSISRAVMVNDF
jgi:hypothetical protein